MTNVLAELSAHRNRKPFMPYAIILTDGRRFTMRRQLQCGFSETRVVLLDDEDLSVFFRPELIAGFELLEPVGS